MSKLIKITGELVPAIVTRHHFSRYCTPRGRAALTSGSSKYCTSSGEFVHLTGVRYQPPAASVPPAPPPCCASPDQRLLAFVYTGVVAVGLGAQHWHICELTA